MHPADMHSIEHISGQYLRAIHH